MNHYQDTFIESTSGRPRPGVDVSVLRSSDGNLAQIFSDANGTPRPNPVLTDSNGFFSFYVEDGSFNLSFSVSGTQIGIQKDVQIRAGLDAPGVRALLLANSLGDSTDRAPTQKAVSQALTEFPSAARLTSSVATLVELKASATGNAKRLNGADYDFVAGDYTGQADDLNIVKADAVPLASGAWIRQRSAGLSARRNAIAAVIRNAQAEFNDAVKITQFGAVGGNKALDTAGFNAAVAYAWNRGRAVCIPDSDTPFVFGRIVLPANESGLDGDAARPDKFTICGSGSVRFDENGYLFDAPSGRYFYDLVIDGTLRFLSTEGAGSKFINGDKFIRLTMNPGLNIRDFDWGVHGVVYLQTLRIIGVTFRGGVGAFVKAPMSYDCSICHNVVEFVVDGVVIDGNGDPAVHTTRIDDNVIEGIAGRAVVLGPCLSTSVSRNYMEGNLAGDILLNAGAAPHKGLIVQGNSIQQHSTRLANGSYSIVWGASLALSAIAGANFSTGHLHDLQGSTGLLMTLGDFAASGKNLIRPGVGRSVTTDGFSVITRWFERFMLANPYHNELEFGGKFSDQGASPVITFGANSPGNTPGAFERKGWARGSVVHNIGAANPGDVSHWICTATGTPGSWRPGGVLPA